MVLRSSETVGRGDGTPYETDGDRLDRDRSSVATGHPEETAAAAHQAHYGR